jgi:ribonuclease J
LDLQRLIRPKFFIPVHGEYRQLLHHARLALEAGLPQSRILIVEDGQTVELDRESIRLGPRVETGRIYVDGIGIGDVGHVVLRDRKLLAHDGLMVVSVTVDRESGALRARPEVISRGLIDPQLSHEIIEDAATAAAQAVRRTSEREPELTVLRGAIHDAVLAVVHTRTKRRPMVIPLVTEI